MDRFIHIPKNGGSAVTTWLQQNHIEFMLGKPGKGVGKHKKASAWEQEETKKFCVVRNPYTRIISYYNYIASTEQWTSFEAFIKNKLAPTRFKIPSPWELQISWIVNSQDQTLCEKIMRYETLESELQEYFDCFSPLPKVNQTQSNPASLQDLTDSLKHIVREHFLLDFQRFGYPDWI